MATQEEVTTLVDRTWNEALEGGELDVIDEAMAEDYVAETPGSAEEIRGRDEFKAYVRGLRKAFPDISVSIDDRIVTEDAIVDRYTIRGTHEGEFKGIEPTGAEFEVPGLIIHYIEDGKVVRDVSEWNVMDMMEQLGVIDAPGT